MTMIEREFPIPPKDINNLSVNWPSEPLRNILVMGHGALAMRQKPTYEHWLQVGVEVHCADADPSKLDDCLDGVHRYVIPGEEQRLLKAAPFDLLCINNVPELHLATALKFDTYAQRIIIQKPQDLNFPLIRTLNTATGFEHLRARAVVHDHYKNKSPFAALLRELPVLHARYGQFRRILFFLTEAKSVNDELDRASSLRCGIVQDLGVHMVDLMLECMLAATEWRDSEKDDRVHRRVGGTIKIESCVKFRQQASVLGDDVETFSALDLHVTEYIEFPADSKFAHKRQHEFDILIVLGKGLAIEQDVVEDLKAIVIEFEREDSFYSVIDLASQGVAGMPSDDVNRQHGGLNRPLMLISPKPPEHALWGAGGLDYPQWQTFLMGEQVTAIAETARQWESSRNMGAYPRHRPLGDFIRQLALRQNRIRPLWGDLPPLTNFQIRLPRAQPYFD